MPDFTKPLKEEISRLAKKEAKSLFQPLQRDKIKLKRDLTQLKRKVARLERDNKRFRAMNDRAIARKLNKKDQNTKRIWFTGKGVKSMRAKLKLTQAELAKLIDVSTQTIVKWEKTNGKLSIRKKEAKNKLYGLRKLGIREVKRLLKAES